MRPSANKPAAAFMDKPTGEDNKTAVLAESLYVANLLIAPGLAFIWLAIIFIKKHGKVGPLARAHLEQTIAASVWIAVMFFSAAITVLILNTAGVEDLAIWMLVIILFTLIHATMVLFGVVGLAKALSGKCWRFPVVGKRLPADCPQ